jgi:hypothetical protein
MTGNSFFWPETLCGSRVLTVAGDGGGAVSVAVEHVPEGVPGASNNSLPLCTTVRPEGALGDASIARFDSLPTVTILASETSAAAEQNPATSASVIPPTNAATYVVATKQWALQSRGGAAALKRLILNALRNKAMEQVLIGDGTNGQVTGLVADAAVPDATGGTLAMSHIIDALDSVESAAGDSALTWVVTSAAAKILRARAVMTGGSEPILHNREIAGYPVVIVGASTAAHAILGKWSDLIIYEWTPLELATNPFAIFRADHIGVCGWFSFSAAPLVNGSFYCIESIT